ncbi:NADP oxidoreductase [Pseudomonas amygdali pv. tabaci str. ATCC 11528]|uniref:Pyrroline-5-carboxylate reductase catalytic N-terminal domain-containing protein n=4 Tax=Pseudomonas syringae group genomosp. 2 TaxID=251698 RepID=A0AAX1VNK0_PSEAJ|nr:MULTISPECIES: NAD(P)-binding domain-containing protein [Pseudomonas syringae group]ARA83499.1 NADP oxidoreductase [Pseudomonas amygdali pv. lachrymans]AXH58640.1 NADP oxidoreductase [Pseudomonas amygdali pv. lachrymans str. M301315]KEZ27212.1 NADP oxidoreductase [Pseudomonas amygdali pv. tabaci str. 6605]KEZ68621.1 NADP oxidoreductase [Pseudomonas amygdali pv. tabaci str. ATCC 11528]KIY16373.1 NADP oxidoreductase [Pseudomonas amygdali pv. tabaci]
MKIGILGTGNIGKSLVKKLSQAGHIVKVANSRGPDTIEADLLSWGARAVTTDEALTDVECVILSIPLNRIPDVATQIGRLPESTVIVDTSNYYPFRDNKIEAIENGQVESLWVAEQLDRPIAKAWNAIGSASLAKKGKPAGAPDRIAIPIAADRDHDKEFVKILVNDTGLDAFDAGSLAQSWRQQPGAPVYCTDLTYGEIATALESAERERLPKRRDLGVAVMQERLGDGTANPDEDWGVRLVRAINI